MLACIVVLSALVAACSGGGSGSKAPKGPATTTKPRLNPAGTITYALEQEPSNFNILTNDGSGFYLQQIMDQVWPSVFHSDQHLNVVLDQAFVSSASQTSSNPQTIVYAINPAAKWSDGTPIDAGDFIYTWQAQSGAAQYTDVEGKPFTPAGTAGFSQIASVTGSPDAKTVTVVFTTPFPDWRSLFAPVAPAHILSKIGFNAGLLADKVSPQTLVSGGPFAMQSYTRGKDFVVVRNPAYWGPPANLAAVDYRFVLASAALEPAVANNEIQVAYPQPQLDLVTQLKTVPGLVLDLKPGLQFEHLDFNESNPFLADVNLRKAIAMTIDRPGLIARTFGQVSPDAKPLNNRIFLNTQPQFRDTSGGIYDKADVAGAKALLTANGYTFSGNTLMSREGKPVTLRITSSQGNAIRQAEEEVVIADLIQIGIKVTEADTTSIGRTGKEGSFDLFIFGWVSSAFPSGSDSIYQTNDGTHGGNNFDHYSNPDVDKLIAQADTAVDPKVQVDLYNQVDALLWRDMVSLPLVQKPTLLAYFNRYVNLFNNPTIEGPSFNEQLWGLTAASG